MLKYLKNPCNWPVFIGYVLARIIIFLPLPILFYLGKIIGIISYSFSPKRRKIALINISACFPKLTLTQQKKLVKDNFISMGISFIEMLLAFWASNNRLKNIYQITGLTNLQTALNSGQGVMLLCGHFHTIEITGRMLCISLGAKLDVVYRKYKNEFIDYIVNKARAKSMNVGVDKKNVRTILKSLALGHGIIYLPDQNFSHGHIFAPFFNIQAATTPATARIAKASGAYVVPFHFQRACKGENLYKISLGEPLTNFPSDDILQDTTRINKIIEDDVKLYPEQYLWVHRRFRTRPPGDKPFYPQDIDKRLKL